MLVTLVTFFCDMNCEHFFPVNNLSFASVCGVLEHEKILFVIKTVKLVLFLDI